MKTRARPAFPAPFATGFVNAHSGASREPSGSNCEVSARKAMAMAQQSVKPRESRSAQGSREASPEVLSTATLAQCTRGSKGLCKAFVRPSVHQVSAGPTESKVLTTYRAHRPLVRAWAQEKGGNGSEL